MEPFHIIVLSTSISLFVVIVSNIVEYMIDKKHGSRVSTEFEYYKKYIDEKIKNLEDKILDLKNDVKSLEKFIRESIYQDS